MKKEEVNYKVKFVNEYFNIKLCEFDVLKEVDVIFVKNSHCKFVVFA